MADFNYNTKVRWIILRTSVLGLDSGDIRAIADELLLEFVRRLIGEGKMHFWAAVAALAEMRVLLPLEHRTLGGNEALLLGSGQVVKFGAVCLFLLLEEDQSKPLELTFFLFLSFELWFNHVRVTGRICF